MRHTLLYVQGNLRTSPSQKIRLVSASDPPQAVELWRYPHILEVA